MTCSETQEEASRAQMTMLAKVDEVLQQNRNLAELLKLLDSEASWDTRSVKFKDTSSLRTRRTIYDQVNRPVSVSSASAISRRPQSLAGSMVMTLSKWNFELILFQSRVYNRTEGREIDRFSFTTSTAPTNGWSMLSGLSIGDISTVSAFRLPITLKDVNRIAPGSTFAVLLAKHHYVADDRIHMGSSFFWDTENMESFT